MKKIKRFTYYIILFSLVLGACGRKDEDDAARLNEINEQVESLYNEEIDDLAEEISSKKLAEIEVKIELENGEELNEENEKILDDIEKSYDNALYMYELEEDIHALFTDEIVDEAVDFEMVEQLATRLAEVDAEKWTSYVPRQEEKLGEADQQMEQRKEAIAAVDNLYNAEGQVQSEVSREDESAAQEVVNKLRNATVRADLEKRLAEVGEVLTEREAAEEVARKEAAEEAARKEAEKVTESVGNFAGYYHFEEFNELMTITEDRFKGFIPNSGSFFDYEIVEVVHNSGDEITLILYHEEYTDEETGGHPISESTTEVTWKLVEGGKYIETNGVRMRRLTAEEYEEMSYGL